MNNAVRQQHIREFFLHRKPSYGLSEAARLLGMTTGRLRREATADDQDAYRVNGRWLFRWRQVAFIAFQQWPLATIHEALGNDAASVLPPLLGLRTLTVRLPEYLLCAIQHAARNDDITIEDWLYRELTDFAGTVADRMERVVPGYRRAYFFPGTEPSNRESMSSSLPSVR